jgi:hypothetical protein
MCAYMNVRLVLSTRVGAGVVRSGVGMLASPRAGTLTAHAYEMQDYSLNIAAPICYN